MVPVIVSRIGLWLDPFTATLRDCESLLCDLRSAYFREDTSHVTRLVQEIQSAKVRMLASKTDRELILALAQEQGLNASNLRELSRLLDGQWPALWTHRLMGLENQISRIQQLGASLWIHSPDSRNVVSELMQLLGAKTPAMPRTLRIVDPDANPVADQAANPAENPAANIAQPVSKAPVRKAA